ncbi:NAD(P)/FAD-dependent oxidoreductase [Achromobacter xylosoxidans]
MRVLVVGAGMAGLALAQKLKAAGIDVAVFERGGAMADSLAGYGILIDGNGQRALRHCLPAAALDAFERTAGHAGTGVYFLDQMARRLTAFEGSAPGQVARRSIERLALRRILSTGLDAPGGPIQWGRTFTHYERLGTDGPIRAHFADGSHADGDVLVGADASNSRVRTQYLGQLRRLDLGITNLVGRVPLTPQLRDSLPGHLTDGSVNNVVPPGPGWMFLSAWRAAAGPGRAADGIEDYLVWAYAAKRASLPGDVEALPGGALLEIALRRIEDGRRCCARCCRARTWTPSARCRYAACRSCRRGSRPRHVDGDAIHNMTPMAGIGANTALRDAALLADRLIEAAEGGAEVDCQRHWRLRKRDEGVRQSRRGIVPPQCGARRERRCAVAASIPWFPADG